MSTSRSACFAYNCSNSYSNPCSSPSYRKKELMEWSVKTFNFFFANGYRGLAGGLLRINAGAKGFAVSSDTCATGAKTFASLSFASGFRPHESSRHTMERITGTWGWIVIKMKGILKKQKKIPLQYFRAFYYCPFLRVFSFSPAILN